MVGLGDHRIEQDKSRNKIVLQFSKPEIVKHIESVKIQFDHDSGFAQAFNSFAKFPHDQQKALFEADSFKSAKWGEEIVEHQASIKAAKADISEAQAEKARLKVESASAVAELKEAYEKNVARVMKEADDKVALLDTSIANWNVDVQQHQKDIQVKQYLLDPSLKIMETIVQNEDLHMAARCDIGVIQEKLQLKTEEAVKNAVEATPPPDGKDQDSWGTKIIITIVAFGVHKHEIHGPDGIDISLKAARRMRNPQQIRLICECLCLTNTGPTRGLFGKNIEQKIRRDQSQDRKRAAEADPESPLNRFRKKMKYAAADTLYKDCINDATFDDDSQE